MSSVGVKVARVSIPSSVWKMIENLKEITGQNHTDDEIYATLKECGMDPNETLDKLLLLDTFHEVKRKRDRRKENQNKEQSETKWKPGTQPRPNRVGRGNHSLRHMSNDAVGGKDLASAKESGTGHFLQKGASDAFSSNMQEKTRNASSSVTSNVIHEDHSSMGNEGVNHLNATVNTSTNKSEGLLPLSAPTTDPIKSPKPLNSKDIQQQQVVDLGNSAMSNAPRPDSYLSSSDPVLLPSQESFPSAVGTIRREVGSHRAPVEVIENGPAKSRSASGRVATPEVGISSAEQKVPHELHAVGKSHQSDTLPAKSSAISSSTSRPSSNYNNRAQMIGSQKVGPGKEWKPKCVLVSNDHGAPKASPSEVSLVSDGNHPELLANPVVHTSKEATSDLQNKLGKLSMSEGQHVIMPDHLHVPEVEKLGFCFGSFDASFGLDVNKHGGPASEKNLPISKSSEDIDEPVTEPQMSYQNESGVIEDTEAVYPDRLESPSQEPENPQSAEVEVSSSTTIDNSESKEAAPENHQHPVGHAPTNYNLGLVPPVISSQLAPVESSESQAHSAPHLPAFVMPQSFDPSSYYAQFYRSGVDTDGRISPFHTAGTSNKYNGSAALVSAQNSQTHQEGAGVPLILSTASPTPLVTQAAGVMQSAVTPTQQQPLPVFRQPTGVPLPHYNYIPYGPYFSPFYVPPPPAIHQFLGNGGAFPQQPQPGSLYPNAAGTSAKYSVSQFKQGSNTVGASNHIGLPGNYGPYGLSMGNYPPSSATSITSTSNEDHAAPQAKENHIYVNGQQNEGSGVWFAAPNRDIPGAQASSFYNLPQGQLAFTTPTHQGHGAFTRMFQPAQAMTPGMVHHPLLQHSQSMTNPADMGGPNAGVYQQPQHAQLNWPGNY